MTDGTVPVKRLPRLRLLSVQIVAVITLLLVAVTLTAPIIWSRMLEHHLVAVVSPPLEQRFGFRAAYEPVDAKGGRVYRLVMVEASGPLGRAGVLAGDLPNAAACAYVGDYIAAETFLDGLQQAADGAAVRLSLYRPGAPEGAYVTAVVGPGSGPF